VWVCSYLCLSASISLESHFQTSPNFLSLLPVARFSFDGAAIRVCYEIPVLWITSCFSIMSIGCITSHRIARYGLLLQMQRGRYSVCMCICVCVCWTQLQNVLKRRNLSKCHLNRPRLGPTCPRNHTLGGAGKLKPQGGCEKEISCPNVMISATLIVMGKGAWLKVLSD